MNSNIQLKVIQTEDQYHAYLKEVEALLSTGLTPQDPEGDRLDLLTIIIENYEKNKYPIEPVDPIEAIKFRMAEKGLKQIDLAPYFGTKSRVSEVLSRKRSLTVPMIKALSIGLGISSDTLLGLDSEVGHQGSAPDIDWSKFPIKEMITRGWLDKKRRSAEEQVKSFIDQLGGPTTSAAFKRTLGGDAYSPATQYSLYAWLARVVQKSRESRPLLGTFDHSVFSPTFLKTLAQLSWSEYGPLLAIEFLKKNGISVVIEPSLKGTLVDGAALKDVDNTPIIALTLRHDRLDNFWFTLLHEVVHIWKHVSTDEAFIDDLDAQSENKIEAEANRIARDTFIPRIIWRRSNAYLSPSKESIDELSRDLKIHPAIIAGRIRRESGDYTKLSDLVGYKEVRKHFPKTYNK